MPREVERRGVAVVDGEVQRRGFVSEMRNSGAAPGTFEGHVAMFNSDSEDLGFIERIKPGAFKHALAKGSTVMALHNHDSNRVLGSTANGTLDLSEDARGLKVAMRPPDTPTAREVATLVEGGFSNGASFAFTVAEGGDAWGIDGKGRVTREISEIDTLLDVSIVTNPAYLAPSVTARSAQKAVEVRSKADPAMSFRAAIESAEPTKLERRAALETKRVESRMLMQGSGYGCPCCLSGACACCPEFSWNACACCSAGTCPCCMGDSPCATASVCAGAGIAVGDRVELAPGIEPHEPDAQGPGTVAVIDGNAVGVQFDSMPGEIHKWYVLDELTKIQPMSLNEATQMLAEAL